jgi:hypothetical protein
VARREEPKWIAAGRVEYINLRRSLIILIRLSHVSPRFGTPDRLELRVRAGSARGFGEMSLPGCLLRALREQWLQLCNAPNVPALDRFVRAQKQCGAFD